ncbi:MAG: hypothetical protein KatS3mg109_0279 [Pirellulaceae bacterium]|nr:MAG: hypothetical protein KatS3mg109_0279 [Pirellulaceae bacterium]
MKCKRRAVVGGLVAAACLLAVKLPAIEPAKPNVVFILADDLGWADTTLYGHTRFYETPNIERLAKRGMTFTRAYAASPLCSPTRASILTGLSPARIGITAPQCHLPQVVLEAKLADRASPSSRVIPPLSATRLQTKYFTLAEALKAAGYVTAHFGKWHLGGEPYSPLEHGFDVDVPHWPGPGPAGSYVAPWKFKGFPPDEPHQHIEDRMAKEAVSFMERNRDKPFYLNYWMFSVHAPFDAKKELVEKYRARVDPTAPQRSPTYAAMVKSMDDAVGTLLDAIDRLGLTENTLIIFFSDNGGNMYSQVDGTVPTSNAPLRGGKATVYEGGIRVPCVISWPGVVPCGSRSEVVVQSCDFYPTILDALGSKPLPGQHFDGISIMPALRGEPLQREAIFTYFPHNPPVPDWLPPAVTVHAGDWKLIRIFHGGDNGAHRWKLFNLREDPGETHDLAAAEPDRVRILDAMIEKFLVETQAVVPVPNPDFDPAQYHPELEGKPRPRQQTSTPSRTAESGDSHLQGWKARNCEAIVSHGVLTVTAWGASPFLGIGAGLDGPVAVSFRARCIEGGRGQIEWILPGEKPDPANAVTFTLKPNQWQKITVTIPARERLGIVRLYVPAAHQPVDIDWIELKSNNKTRRWDF